MIERLEHDGHHVKQLLSELVITIHEHSTEGRGNQVDP